MSDPNARGPQDASARPVRRGDLTVHELDGEALIYDASSADTHRLNSTALFIWRLCDGRYDPEQIAQKVADVYEVSLDDARRHVLSMIEAFARRQLVVPPASGGEDGPGV